MKAILVTGAMRTGGSAVATIIDAFGINLGRMFCAPIPPLLRLEWEDYEAYSQLLEWYPIVQSSMGRPAAVTPEIVRAWFAMYWAQRAANMRVASGLLKLEEPVAVAFKSPFAAHFAVDIMEGAIRVGLEPVLICTTRNKDARHHSFETRALPLQAQEHWPDVRLRQQQLVEEAGKLRPDLRLDYDDVQENPRAAVIAVSKLIPGVGVREIRAVVDRLNALVLKPTTLVEV